MCGTPCVCVCVLDLSIHYEPPRVQRSLKAAGRTGARRSDVGSSHSLSGAAAIFSSTPTGLSGYVWCDVGVRMLSVFVPHPNLSSSAKDAKNKLAVLTELGIVDCCTGLNLDLESQSWRTRKKIIETGLCDREEMHKIWESEKNCPEAWKDQRWGKMGHTGGQSENRECPKKIGHHFAGQSFY